MGNIFQYLKQLHTKNDLNSQLLNSVLLAEYFSLNSESRYEIGHIERFNDFRALMFLRNANKIVSVK